MATEIKALTTAAVARLKAENKGGRRIVRDAVERGLFVEIGAKSASWRYCYRLRDANRTKRVVLIGDGLAMSATEARRRVAELKDRVRRGEDPIGDARAAKSAALSERAGRKTLVELAVSWQPRGRTRTVVEEHRGLRLALREMQAECLLPSELTRRHVSSLVTRHQTRPATCRLRIGAVRRFLTWLKLLGEIEINLAADIAELVPPPPPPRNHVPSAAAIKAVWEAAEGLSPDFRDYTRLLIAVPLRRTAAATLTVDEIDVAGATLTLAESRTKNATRFELPLNALAIEILGPRVEGKKPGARVFLFGGGDSATSMGWSKWLRRLRQLASVPDFNPHSLRTAFATECAEHEIGTPDVIDQLLNHKQSETLSGIRGVYMRPQRREQRRAIMRAWNGLLEHAIATGTWPRQTATAGWDVVGLSGER